MISDTGQNNKPVSSFGFISISKAIIMLKICNSIFNDYAELKLSLSLLK
jgi:hypothetical protein